MADAFIYDHVRTPRDVFQQEDHMQMLYDSDSFVVLHMQPDLGLPTHITRADGSKTKTTLTLRIDTPIEVDYFRAGGILPYVLRQLLA